MNLLQHIFQWRSIKRGGGFSSMDNQLIIFRGGIVYTSTAILYVNSSENVTQSNSILRYKQVVYHIVLYCMDGMVPGRFEPPVTVIMLSPGVTGASRHLGFYWISTLPSGESSGSVQPLAQFVLTADGMFPYCEMCMGLVCPPFRCKFIF